jgi:hypothetical protein
MGMAMSRRLHTSHAPRRTALWRAVLSLSVCLTLALAPAIAEARAGSSSSGGKSSSSSMGSRGSRSFDQNGAAPLTRSANPTPAVAGPAAGGAAAAP